MLREGPHNSGRQAVRGLNIRHRVRLWQRQDHVSAKPQGGWHRTRAVILAVAAALVVAVTARAEYDPPIATTYSFGEDSEAREGWSLHNYLGLRSASGTKWERDPNKTLRIQVKGRPSPHRAYKTEIILTPIDGYTYRYGENIDIALTFNTDVYVPEDDSWIIIRIGDATSGPNTRVAEYLSGSDTNRLVYRYQVEFDDVDANGISVDEGGLDTGFVGSVPTIVVSSGLLPVERYFPGVADDPTHKVDGSLQGAVGMSSRRGNAGIVWATVANDARLQEVRLP